MSHDFDIETFLRKPLVAHLATGSSEGPRDSPLWFLWEDASLWLVGSERDSFPQRIRAEPRCAVGIVDFDLVKGELRHVGIRGRGTVEALDPERLHRLLRRYLGEDKAMWNPRFQESVIQELDLMVRIVPTSTVARDQSYFSNQSPKQLRSGREASHAKDQHRRGAGARRNRLP